MAAPASSSSNQIVVRAVFREDPQPDPRVTCRETALWGHREVTIYVDRLSAADIQKGSIRIKLWDASMVEIPFRAELDAFEEATGRKLKELSAVFGQAVVKPS